MELLVVFGGIGVMGVLMFLGARYLPEDLAAKRELWARIAHEYNGAHVVGAQTSFSSDRMVVPLRGGEVILSEARHAGQKRVLLRARAVLPRSLPRFSIVPESPFHLMPKALARPNVVLGLDPGFDEKFVVTAEHPALVRRLWTVESARRTAETDYLPQLIRCDGSELVVDVLLWGREDQRVRTSIDLVKSLFERDLYGLAALAALDGALSVSADGVPSVVARAPRPVRVTAEVLDGELRTVAYLLDAVPGGLAPLRVALPAEGVALDRAGLPARSVPLLARVGRGCLEIDGDRRARIRFDEVVERPARLQSAAAALCALGVGHETAVYR